MTIVEFLQARISEDEAAEARKWKYSNEKITAALGPCAIEYHSAEKVLINPYEDDGPFWMDAPEFRALYGEPAPDARMLAECAAKRAIIEQADEASSDRQSWVSEYCVGEVERAEAYANDPGKLILEALAAVYSDHPEYQEEWA